MLMFVMVFAFYFTIPMWQSSFSMGAQLLGFSPLQPFGEYLLEAYVSPGAGQWPMPGVH